MFVDIHSHVVPSGDDGARDAGEGLDLARSAARHGTSVLFATPHVWPGDGLSEKREQAVRAIHAQMAATLAEEGLDLRLGFELTPSSRLLDDDPARYRLGDLPYVLVELPFTGPLGLAEELAAHVEAAGLTPVIAHPERAEAVLEDPRRAFSFAERWPVQVNATSLCGYHGTACEELGWHLVEGGHARIVASDGHRASRPPHLDSAYEAARRRLGQERALPLFTGALLGDLAARDGLDVAQRRQAV
jgi:protein-tyrosine phosphatase